jgi:mono/diheme cytochrome c family protein
LRYSILMRFFPIVLAIALLPFLGGASTEHSSHSTPTFYRDVLPILQDHCQQCHRAQGIASTSYVTYAQTEKDASDIADAVIHRTMPPWFADPRYGKFSNDPSLTDDQIATLVSWAKNNAPAGNQKDAPPIRNWAGQWDIPHPDLVLGMPVPVKVPATGHVEYTYEIVPTHFAKDAWVQMSQVRPSSPQYVHHAVIYIRPPSSTWLRSAPIAKPFTAGDLTDAQGRRETHWTTSDMLLVYAPGSAPDKFPDGLAKFVPAGSDLVFQMHYTPNGTAGADQTSVGMVFAKQPPSQRVITIQLTNSSFIIPPETDDVRVEVHGTIPNDATLLSFFPHMHLRGKRFEYNIVHEDRTVETLLRVNYHFHWQLSYELAQPRLLKAGTELQAIAWFDNSRNNPHNPDPTKMVRWGDQTSDEMMVGFFDVAVPAGIDKWQFFKRKQTEPTPGH